jgi:Skp family chaperone for outer membrane proteins
VISAEHYHARSYTPVDKTSGLEHSLGFNPVTSLPPTPQRWTAKKRLLMLVPLTVLALAAAAEAQSQAGGLPDVSVRVQVLETQTKALETQTKALETQVTTLKTEAKALETRVNTLQSDNAALQTALSKEVETRQAADTEVIAALSKEVQQRQAADTEVTAALSKETAERTTADTALSNSTSDLEEQLNVFGKVFAVSVPSTFLVNGQLGTVATLAPMPAGRYLVIAKAVVENDIHDSGWACLLFRNAEHLTSDVLDHSSARTESGPFRLARGTVSMVAVATLSEPGSFRMDCSTDENGSDLFGVKIVAVSVQ